LATWAAFLLLSGVASAAVPQLINYQGRLTNAVGAPLDTTVTLVFNICSDSLGTNNLWSETHPGTVITNGLFQVLLGSVNALAQSVFDGSKRWLGVQLQGGPAATTLIPIVSVAYAYRSAKSDTAGYAVSGGGDGWTDDGTIVRLSTVTDSVGIGNSSPSTKLHVGFAASMNQIAQIEGLTVIRTNGSGQPTTLRLTNLNATANSGVSLDLEGLNSSAVRKGTAKISGFLTDQTPLNEKTALTFYTGDYADDGLAERVRIDRDGNVGIGKTNPAQKLDVAGTAQVNGFKMPTGASNGHVLTSDGNGVGTWQTPSAPAAGGWTDDGTAVRLTTASDKVGIGTPSPKVQLDLTDMLRVGGCTWPAPGSGEGLELAYNPTNNLGYIQSYDRTTSSWMDLSINARRVMVGDNTPAPSARLHIYNFTSDWNTPQLRLEEFGVNNYSSIIHSNTGLQFRNYYATESNMAYSFGDPANALLFGVTARGNVKIKGHVEFPTNSIIAFMGANTQDQYFNFYSGDYQSRSYDAHIRAYGQGSSVGYVEMNHDGTNANILADVGDINIQPAANVGIGTGDPKDKLQVKGNVRLDNGAGNGSALRFAEADTLKWALLYRPWALHSLGFWDEQVSRWAISMEGPTGDVGINTDNPEYQFDVAGLCHATGFPTSSDVRLKKNIQPLGKVLEKLDQIRSVTFDWNEVYDSLGRSSGHREIGVIAQDVEAQFPELVTKWEGSDYRAVDYGRMTSVLIEAVKELKKENELLKQRLEALEKR